MQTSWSEVKSRLELSLAQFSPSLFLFEPRKTLRKKFKRKKFHFCVNSNFFPLKPFSWFPFETIFTGDLHFLYSLRQYRYWPWFLQWYGHIHIDNYGHFSVFDIMATIDMAILYYGNNNVQCSYCLKEYKKCRSPAKTVSKRINLSKVMAKTCHRPKSLPFNSYFEPILGWKYGF